MFNFDFSKIKFNKNENEYELIFNGYTVSGVNMCEMNERKFVECVALKYFSISLAFVRKSDWKGSIKFAIFGKKYF